MDSMSEFQEDPPMKIIQIVDSLQTVGEHFQECIQSVEGLLEERENLIKELAFVKEPIHKKIESLREELLKLYLTKSKTEIECDNFKQEIASTKQNLFKIIKAQMACKYKLNVTKQTLPQLAAEQEVLKSKARVLSDELTQLKNHKETNQIIQQLENIQNTKNIQTSSKSHQANREFQNFARESWQWLDKYYVPKLGKLMKWNKSRSESLRLTQQQIKTFIKQLQPLQDEVTRLNLQRQHLEQQLQFMQRKWAEDILQYQKEKNELQEKVSLLKIELKLQKQKNDDIRHLKESLTDELFVYKESLTACGNLIESSNKLV